MFISDCLILNTVLAIIKAGVWERIWSMSIVEKSFSVDYFFGSVIFSALGNAYIILGLSECSQFPC